MLWFFCGYIVGLINATLLARSVLRIVPEQFRASLVLVVGGFFLRLVLVAAAFVVALQRGVLACLLVFAGVWLARWSAVYYWGAADRIEQAR